MHRVAQEIDSILGKANLTPNDFLQVTERLVNHDRGVEDEIIRLLARLSVAERDTVMVDLAKLAEGVYARH
jgi:hypothetical protein